MARASSTGTEGLIPRVPKYYRLKRHLLRMTETEWLTPWGVCASFPEMVYTNCR